jgi:hypothetical protein
LAAKPDRLGADTESGLRPEGAAGEHHPVHTKRACFRLGVQLLQGRHESHRADCVRCAHRNEVGTAPGGARLRRDLVRHGLPRAIAGKHHLRTEQVFQQQVPVPDRRRVAAQDHHAPQTAARGGRGGLPGVIGLHPAHRDERVRALIQRVRHREFELAGLVAAGGETGLVVALDEKAGASKRTGQARQLLQRGGETPKRNARQVISEHGTPPPG